MSTSHPRLPVLERLDHRAMRSLGAEWDALLDASTRPSPYLAWPWIAAWLDTLGAEADLEVVSARDPRDGTLLGVAPFVVSAVRRRGLRYRALRLLGTGPLGAHRFDLPIIAVHAEEVAPALWDAVCRDRRWDLIELTGVAADGVLASLVMRRRSDGALMERRVIHHIDLADLAEPGALSSGHGIERLIVGRSDVDITLERLARMAEEPRRASDRAPFAHPSVLGFHREAAGRLLDSGRLRLWRLDRGDATVAVLYAVRFGDEVACHTAGIDPGETSPAAIYRLIGHAARAAADEGAARLLLPPGIDGAAVGAKAGFDLRIRRPAGSWGRLLWIGRGPRHGASRRRPR